MADYKEMYCVLCAAADKALRELDDGIVEKAKETLQKALFQAEEIYIETSDD